MSDDYELRERLYVLMADFGIYSEEVRAAMLQDPERAILLLEAARRPPRKIRNPAAWAITRFRHGEDPRSRHYEPEPEPELELGLPTVEGIDYIAAEARRSWVGVAMMRLVAIALEREGGYPELVARLELRKRELEAFHAHRQSPPRAG